MIRSRRRSAPAILAVAGTLALLAACAPPRGAAPGRLTPVRQRMSDEAIARDLAVFDSYERRARAAAPNATGSAKYLAARATEYVRIARDAYERNDRSEFVEDALSWAAADIETLERGAAPATLPTAVPMPKGVARVDEALWRRADALRSAPGSVEASDDLARAEVQLMRSGHSFLAGPACVDELPSAAAGRLLDVAERSRTAGAPPAVAIPPQPVQVQPAPVQPAPVQPAPATPPAAARPACNAPDRLVGVPTIVHFALDRSTLAPTTSEVLDRLVEALRPYPGIRVTVSGHTDFRASNEYNQALSERRANAVRDYVLSRGFRSERLDVTGFGETRLLTHTDAPMDHARNRRVAITYTLCDGTAIEPVEGLSDLQLEAVRRAQMREKD